MLNRSNFNEAPVARPFSSTKFTTASLEPLEDRKLMSASYDIGINLNDASTTGVSKIVPVLKKMGVKSVRLWFTVADFNKHIYGGALARSIDYSNAGFDVTVEINTKGGKVPNASAVKGWFDWASSNKSLAAAVDRWEIGNEPDHKEYWNGSLSQYVTGYLKPAYEALHANGEQVVSAGPSWNPQDVQTMMNSGLLNYTDYVGFHPYAHGVSGVINNLKKINEVVAGRKPIALTEWNVRGLENSKAAWAKAVEEVYPYIPQYSALNYYFATKVQSGPAGPGAILTTSYTPNAYFYNAFATFSGANTGSSGGGSTNTGNTGGNTASGVGASISGTLWGDNDGDGKMESGEPIAGGRTVYIDENGNGKLDKGEVSTTTNSKGVYKFSGLKARTYKISRVFPSGYKISNSSRTYVTATVATSQQMTGINIGSIPTNFVAAKPPASAGNTPSSVGASISGTLWGDSNANGKIDAGEVFASGRTVFIDENGNGKLDKGEVSTTTNSKGVYKFGNLKARSYKVSRVFPSGYKISNSSTTYIGATVTTGQQFTGVNIGSIPNSKKPVNTGTTGTTGSTTAAPAVTGFQILAATTGKVIGTYSSVTSNVTIKLSSLPTWNLAIVALTNGSASSLKLTAMGKTTTQNNAPFPFFGTQSSGKYKAWTVSKGSHTFTATAYGSDNAAGTKGNTKSVTITFV